MPGAVPWDKALFPGHLIPGTLRTTAAPGARPAPSGPLEGLPPSAQGLIRGPSHHPAGPCAKSWRDRTLHGTVSMQLHGQLAKYRDICHYVLYIVLQLRGVALVQRFAVGVSRTSTGAVRLRQRATGPCQQRLPWASPAGCEMCCPGRSPGVVTLFQSPQA